MNAPLRALVVDDEEDTRESFCTLLRLWGHEARCAADGQSALREAEAFRPNVVLLDLALPGMDGFEVASRLRQLPGCRLVAVSGLAGKEAEVRARACGCDFHLTKPADPEQLRRLLSGNG